MMTQHWRMWLLLAVPLVLTAISPNWLYNPIRLNAIDPWIYHALFRDYAAFAQDAHASTYYFIERVGLLLPATVLYAALPPLLANAVLHLGVVYASVFGLYATARTLFGRDAALLSALMLAGYTWFLRSAGHDYVDGIGVAYVLWALWFATEAAYGRRVRLMAFGAGVCMALTIGTQIIWGAFLPWLAVYYLVLNRQHARQPWVTTAAGVVSGILVALVGMAAWYFAYTGAWNPFAISISLSLAIRGDLADSVREMVVWSYARYPSLWLVLPCAVAVWAALVLARPRGALANLKLMAVGWCAVLGTFALLHYVSAFAYLYIYLYMSMVIPVVFLLLAGVLAAVRLPPLTPTTALVGAAGMLGVWLVAVTVPVMEASLREVVTVWAVIALALVVMTVSRRPAVLLLTFGVLSVAVGGYAEVYKHDRTANLRVFEAVDDSLRALATLAPDIAERTMWVDGVVERLEVHSLFHVHWASNTRSGLPTPDQVAALDDGQVFTVLTDDPFIAQSIAGMLPTGWRLETLSAFPLLSIQPDGRYRGVVLRVHAAES
jgi:hypothetical protein